MGGGGVSHVGLNSTFINPWGTWVDDRGVFLGRLQLHYCLVRRYKCPRASDDRGVSIGDHPLYHMVCKRWWRNLLHGDFNSTINLLVWMGGGGISHVET